MHSALSLGHKYYDEDDYYRGGIQRFVRLNAFIWTSFSFLSKS